MEAAISLPCIRNLVHFGLLELSGQARRFLSLRPFDLFRGPDISGPYMPLAAGEEVTRSMTSKIRDGQNGPDFAQGAA